jgi:MmyB-like transcription regulator ligand binding domain
MPAGTHHGQPSSCPRTSGSTIRNTAGTAAARPTRSSRRPDRDGCRVSAGTTRGTSASTVSPIGTLTRKTGRHLDPLPAVLINSGFDIIESNDAHEDLFWDWHSLPCVHKNLLWCCVTEPTARDQFLDYDREVAYLVARLRAAYGRHVGEPEWEEDIRRLADLSSEFASLWARQEVAGPQERMRRFRHPAAGVLTFTSTELEISAAPELRIVVNTPGMKTPGPGCRSPGALPAGHRRRTPVADQVAGRPGDSRGTTRGPEPATGCRPLAQPDTARWPRSPTPAQPGRRLRGEEPGPDGWLPRRIRCAGLLSLRYIRTSSKRSSPTSMTSGSRPHSAKPSSS